MDPNHRFSGRWIIFNTFHNHWSENKKIRFRCLTMPYCSCLPEVSHGITNEIKPAIRHIPIKNMGQKYIFYGFNVVKKYSICKYDTTSLNTLFRFLQPNTCPPIPNIQLMHLQDNNHPALSKLLWPTYL